MPWWSRSVATTRSIADALAAVLEPKTRIGSPYVIAGMEAAARKGRTAVCGWEANGGFLVGSDIHRDGKTLRALPTRDAVLPILTTLFAARERRLSLDRACLRSCRRAIHLLDPDSQFPAIGGARS